MPAPRILLHSLFKPFAGPPGTASLASPRHSGWSSAPFIPAAGRSGAKSSASAGQPCCAAISTATRRSRQESEQPCRCLSPGSLPAIMGGRLARASRSAGVVSGEFRPKAAFRAAAGRSRRRPPLPPAVPDLPPISPSARLATASSLSGASRMSPAENTPL